MSQDSNPPEHPDRNEPEEQHTDADVRPVEADDAIDGADREGDEPTDEANASLRPGRPDMRRAEPPRSQVMTRPRRLDRALGLFRGGIGLGGVAVLSGVVWRKDARRTLLVMMEDLDGSEATKSTLASVLLYGSLVVMALFLLVELIMLSRLSNGRGWARWFLVVWVPVNAVALILLQEVISGDRWHAIFIQLFLLGQVLASVVAMVMIFSPKVTRWLRQKDGLREPPTGPTTPS